MGALNGTLAQPGTQLIESATTFDGPVTFTSAAPITTSAALTSTAALTSQSLNGTGPAPAAAVVTAGAGAGSTATQLKGHDLGGSVLITAAGTPAAGVVANITFGTALATAPVSVVVTIVDTTASPNTALAAGAANFSTTGFSVSSAVMTAAHAYLVSWVVVAS